MNKSIIISNGYTKSLAWGALAGVLGLTIATAVFNQSLLLVAAGLSSLLLIEQMNTLLDENRDAIWLNRRSPWEANLTLTMKVVSLFTGIFLASSLYQILATHQNLIALVPNDTLYLNEAAPLFQHNLRVLIASTLLAFIYRAGGILVVIAWNAMTWASSIHFFVHSAHQMGVQHAWFYALAIVPHLMLEAIAYITAGMSGVFLSKALFKYKLSSKKFFRVSRASVVILTTSVISLWLAMHLEIGLAQSVLKQLHR